MSAPSIEERLRALEDQQAILRALYDYGHAIDYGRADEFLDCFTEDAELHYSFEIANALGATGRSDMAFRGHAEIAQFFANHTHAPERYHKHFLVAPVITIDGDRATVESYNARLDAVPDGPRTSSFGRYRDVFVRCPDGRWRFRERRSQTESRVPVAPTSR